MKFNTIDDELKYLSKKKYNCELPQRLVHDDALVAFFGEPVQTRDGRVLDTETDVLVTQYVDITTIFRAVESDAYISSNTVDTMHELTDDLKRIIALNNSRRSFNTINKTSTVPHLNMTVLDIRNLREQIILRNKLSVEDRYNAPREPSAWMLGSEPLVGLDKKAKYQDKITYQEAINDTEDTMYSPRTRNRTMIRKKT